MSQEPEEIRQEMDETRESLTEKISLLESQVVETVHQASSGVKETIESVKSVVEDTVQTVKESVDGTVESVKETFDISRQVQRRPWLMMAGCVGVGFAAGYLVSGASAAPAAAPEAEPETPTPQPSVRRSGNGLHQSPASVASPSVAVRPAVRQPAATPVGADSIAQAFESEISQLKGLAIGAAIGIVRDFVVRAAPDVVRSPLAEIFNDFTNKLGGQTFKGQILSEEWQADDGDAGPAEEQQAQQERQQERRPQDSGYRNPRQTSYSPN